MPDRQKERQKKRKKQKPRGREQVVAALLESAAELFAKRGVAGVSLRQIAAHAGVNHGLIYRHFGSKENLRKKTQEYLAEKVRDYIGMPDNLMEVLERAEAALDEHPEFWKVMARSFLDGQVKGDIQSEFPFVSDLVELVREGQRQNIIKIDLDPRFVVAALCAYGLGVRVFEGYIMEGTGLGNEPTEKVLEKIRNYFVSLFVDPSVL